VADFLTRLKRGYLAFAGKTTGKRMYAAAEASRLSGPWQAANSSADHELSSSLRQLRSRSRALCRDVSYAKRAKLLVVNNVIGSGIGMQGQVKGTRGELITRINDDIEARWAEWCAADSCHTGGGLQFAEFERTCMAQIFEAGEVFIRKHQRAFGSSKVPYALELIEAERIADELTSQSVSATTGNNVRMGIEVDKFHRPVAYFIRTRHPNEYTFGSATSETVERVPADQIIHLASRSRWPQVRGEPWLHAVISTLKNMAGYTEAEIIRARTQACTVGAIETPEDSASLGEEQADGTVEMEVEPGIFKRLNPGEKFTAGPSGSPNPALSEFMRYMLREFAAGAGPSYESISRDYSQSNYSSSRLALLDDKDLWRVVQSWFINAFRLPVHKEWLGLAVLSRAVSSISVESYALDASKYQAIRFRPRGWGWVDPTKEVDASVTAIRAGLATQQSVLAQSGEDFEEVLDQLKKEREAANTAGVVLETDPAHDKEVELAKKAEPPGEPPKDTSKEDDESTENPAQKSRVLRLQR
jgi:lambda family phage portal protein